MALTEFDIMKILIKKYPENAKTERESEIMTSVPEWCNQENGLPLTNGLSPYSYALGEIPDDTNLEDLTLEDFEVKRHELEIVNDDGIIESRPIFTAIYKRQ